MNPPDLVSTRAAIAANPADAEAHCRLGNLLWAAGDHEGALFHLASATAHAPNHLDARNNLGNALMALGRTSDAITEFRAAIALHPERGELHYNLGNALMAAETPGEAEAAYRCAIVHDPEHAGAHNNLGNTLRALGHHGEAVESYKAALALRPEYFGMLNNIGSALLGLHQPDAAEPWLRRAVTANPDYAEACNNLGGALLALDQPGEAVAWFRRAVTLDPAQAQARFGEALSLLALGAFRAGWRAYETRWQDPRFTADVPEYATPIWQGGGNISGRTILLHAEQGLGDTIQFVRYAAQIRARGARVVLQVQHPLVGLLGALGDEILPQSDTPRDDPIPAHELRCPLLSLPHAFGTRRNSIPAGIPYIAADPIRIAAWQHRLGPRVKRRIGIAFSGSPKHPDDALRSIPAAAMLNAFATTNAELHVIQNDIREADAAALAAHPAVRVHADALTDFSETAALIAGLDHIVTVDTSLAHLAGAMGRPVSILLQHAADFRWLRNRSDSPWYPTATLHRQTQRNDWTTPLAAVVAETSR